MSHVTTKKRLQFDFTEDAVQELDELQRLTGVPSRAELIRHALGLLHWVLEETSSGDATLLIEKNGRLRQIVFPLWAARTSALADSKEAVPEDTKTPEEETVVTTGAD